MAITELAYKHKGYTVNPLHQKFWSQVKKVVAEWSTHRFLLMTGRLLSGRKEYGRPVSWRLCVFNQRARGAHGNNNVDEFKGKLPTVTPD